ncbi:hypothetical protein K435DRAFT_767780 [Dendrothele bispora CBS 962.96]|uniref:Uncharacterized protein n=1 Tax=Dendrothele bispora (strain CBS 962.96) TaxID=1314807 RepID=A0A4V4HBW3_DENBC|nr:hypothetical protein K435DRAFT_767780 [Dendrothele bispora CBS 962.96]
MLLLYALAHPLPSLLASTNESLPSPEPLLEALNSCSDIHSCRTVEEILYSCLAVVFACTWVAIHPNIPRKFDIGYADPNEIADSFTISSARVFAQDVITMILSLLAPELIVLWAMRQWFAARQIAKKYSKYGWTKTHGHFLIMGGFTLFENNGYLSRCLLEFLIQHKYINITEDEITARSKTDFLTKSIAVVQTTWFILQCIARVTEGLVVTDLEIVTVAFALLNIVTYILWWDKPQRVRYPMKVDYRRRHVPREVKVMEDRLIWRGIKAMFTSFCDWIHQLPQRNTNVRKSFTDWIEKTWRPLFRHLRPDRVFFIFWNVIITFWMNIGYMTAGEGSYKTGLELDPSSIYPAIPLFLVFGGIHCAPWNSTFPTHIEQILWRVSAVTVTAFPLVWFPLVGVRNFLDDYPSRMAINIQSAIAAIAFFPLPLVYIGARIALIVIAFMELRALPPSAYQTVDWARFIPHI